MKNKTGKRLNIKKWKEIRVLLKDPNRNISKIARKYKIDRGTIYQYAWRRGWIKRENTNKNIFEKIREWFR